MPLTLEEMLKKATIDFPWNLTLEQGETLVRYIEKKLRIDKNVYVLVKYKPGYLIKSGQEYGYHLPFDEKTADPEGTISLSNPPFTNSLFNFKLSKDKSKLENLQFLLPKDFEKTKYNPDMLQLWDDVKWAVDDYFEENQDPTQKILKKTEVSG